MSQKCWYKIYHNECVLCGHDDKYKERVYEKPEQTHEYRQVLCYSCQYREFL
jgi:Zn ribbon nucleic-acid-binding protein